MRLKDPLYSRAAGDPRRRSAQSALLYVLTRFLTVLAPVLSFTAEEAWQSLPAFVREHAESVFDSSFDSHRQRDGALESDLGLWQQLRTLRGRVAAVASPRDFEAALQLTVTPGLYRRLVALGDNLREALVVSQLDVQQAERADGDGVVSFEMFSAEGAKCARCWKYRELGTDPDYPSICADCSRVVRDL